MVAACSDAVEGQEALPDWLGDAPLGYRTLSNGASVVNAEGMATVERARERRAVGLSLRRAGTMLTSEGRHAKRRGQWGPATVRLLLAPRYVESLHQ
jgi:hypothetical protein